MAVPARVAIQTFHQPPTTIGFTTRLCIQPHMRSWDRVWNFRDIPPCPAERGEQERLPQGGPSFGPLVGTLDSC
jgi:hypothetical protein